VRADADGVIVSEKGQTSASHPWQARAITPVNDTQGPLATSSSGNRTSLTMRSSDERDLERGLVAEKIEPDEKKEEAVTMAARSVSMHGGTGTHQSRQPMPGRTDSSSTEDSEHLARRDCVIIRIEISDNGGGISPNDMKDLRVFSAFTQTETGRVQGGKGTGLGLAIVARSYSSPMAGWASRVAAKERHSGWSSVGPSPMRARSLPCTSQSRPCRSPAQPLSLDPCGLESSPTRPANRPGRSTLRRGWSRPALLLPRRWVRAACRQHLRPRQIRRIRCCHSWAREQLPLRAPLSLR